MPRRRGVPAGRTSRLDEFAPAYQFSEVHDIRIRASSSRIYRSIKE
jgi:hypothetical protein